MLAWIKQIQEHSVPVAGNHQERSEPAAGKHTQPKLRSHPIDDEAAAEDGGGWRSPGRVWFGNKHQGGAGSNRDSGSQRRGRVERCDTETATYKEEAGMVHCGSRKRVAGVAATSSAVCAAAALAAGYWAVRALLHVFHRARRTQLRSMLLDLIPALESANQTYWLDFGTLLGVHRDGDIIPHDNDIDVAVLDPAWEVLLPRLQQLLRPKGYMVKEVHPSEDPNTTFLRVYSSLGVADLFGAYSHTNGSPQQQKQQQPTEEQQQTGTNSHAQDANGGGAATGNGHEADRGAGYKPASAVLAANAEAGWDGCDKLSVQLGHGDCCDIPSSLVLPTGRLEFCGISMAVPGDVAGALEYRYGPDWRVPKYMDKGSDVVEQQKLYARVFSSLGKLGIRI